MKKIIITLLLLIISSITINAQQRKANKDTEAWRYEIEAVQTGIQGTYLIKVWSYSKKPEVATEQCKKNAIHGIIFKGFAGKSGVPGQSPLTNNSDLEIEKADFFKTFFSDGGKYMKFVTLSNDGAVDAEDRMKIGKEYKIGVIVSVNVSELRKDLETAQIIKSLSSGF
ncbi:hypothetical protein CLU81_0519 [Flavobacterium sp. 9]|uniref:hypothetical protein n=1 Tax=Flavobacterium sp. 9 TaxID=2035198 RepID=UPI000C17CA5A|nr:hypothetical protein [Flavobacterium sp. 9]PIF30117.1 hypothetical protein CLU81_0519 [Flavobacterium sp. 9]